MKTDFHLTLALLCSATSVPLNQNLRQKFSYNLIRISNSQMGGEGGGTLGHLHIRITWSQNAQRSSPWRAGTGGRDLLPSSPPPLHPAHSCAPTSRSRYDHRAVYQSTDISHVSQGVWKSSMCLRTDQWNEPNLKVS